MSKRLIFWIIFLAVGLGLLIFANFFRDKGPQNISQKTPAPSETVEPSPSPFPKPSPKPISASCQISGQIIFLDKNLYENKGARIVYQNVDDPIRQIYWKSDPADGVLVVGPNLFENLALPDGERNVGIALAKEPGAKNYNLTASITYGIKNARGSVEERIADCVGKVVVDVSNI